jgi:hypothetical protein
MDSKMDGAWLPSWQWCEARRKDKRKQLANLYMHHLGILTPGCDRQRGVALVESSSLTAAGSYCCLPPILKPAPPKS